MSQEQYFKDRARRERKRATTPASVREEILAGNRATYAAKINVMGQTGQLPGYRVRRKEIEALSDAFHHPHQTRGSTKAHEDDTEKDTARKENIRKLHTDAQRSRRAARKSAASAPLPQWVQCEDQLCLKWRLCPNDYTAPADEAFYCTDCPFLAPEICGMALANDYVEADWMEAVWGEAAVDE